MKNSKFQEELKQMKLQGFLTLFQAIFPKKRRDMFI